MTFCSYTIFPQYENFINRFGFKDENGIELVDSVGIIFVELSKIDAIMKKPIEDMTGEEVWALFFSIGSDPKHRDLLNKMISIRSEIKMASELLQTISKDERERALYLSRKMFEMDMQHNLIVARDEGLEQGRKLGLEQGLEQGKKEIAINALKMNIPIDSIASITGLSIDEIETLKEQN